MRVMATNKQRRFGNPARQAEVDAREQERVIAAQAGAVLMAAQRKTDADCTTGCCG